MGFFSWDLLGTFAGCMGAVALITELIKNITFIKKIPTQLVSWVIAFVILLAATIVNKEASFQNIAMNVINAGLVSLATNGGYEAVKRITSGQTASSEATQKDEEIGE